MRNFSYVKLLVVLTKIIVSLIIIRAFANFYACILFSEIWSSVEPDREAAMLLGASLKLNTEY